MRTSPGFQALIAFCWSHALISRGRMPRGSLEDKTLRRWRRSKKQRAGPCPARAEIERLSTRVLHRGNPPEAAAAAARRPFGEVDMVVLGVHRDRVRASGRGNLLDQ